MMGRYQPWHGGHRELFKQAVKKPPLKDNGLFKGDTAFFFFLSDWQLGKDDYGVENTIKRFDVALQDGVKLTVESLK